MNHIICLVGMCGSGKSIVADGFMKEGYLFVRFGQLTIDTLQKQGLDINEENERRVREGLRREHGMGAYALLNLPKFETLLQQGNVVADGLYSWEEYKILKQHYGKRMKVVAVLASPEIRYRRLILRTQIDEQKRNRPMTREQAISRDYAEIENSDKGGPIAMADYYIVNNFDLEHLQQEIEQCMRWLNHDTAELG